ncbi:MAG: hypothetical protein ACRD2G_13980 [Terriglobia bacterium]
MAACCSPFGLAGAQQGLWLPAIQSMVILSEAKDLLLLDDLLEKQIFRYAQNDN